MDQLEGKGFIPTEFVVGETEWFYNQLGIDDTYFQTESVEAIVTQILSLYAAKVAAYARDDKKLEIRLDKEAEFEPTTLWVGVSAHLTMMIAQMALDRQRDAFDGAPLVETVDEIIAILASADRLVPKIAGPHRHDGPDTSV